MFREMRRKKQLMSKESTEEILTNGVTGILAVLGDEEYPYSVPVNYIYENGKIYFHCAKKGHKLDAIKKHDKVSFCVIDQEQIVPEKFTTYYRSVIAFGKAAVVRDDAEKLRVIRLLNTKYVPGSDEAGEKAIKRGWNALRIVQIEVEHLTGKEAKGLVKRKN